MMTAKVKKQTAQRSVSEKENVNLNIIKTQLENVTNHQEKNGIGLDTLKKDHEEFVKKYKSILKR